MSDQEMTLDDCAEAAEIEALFVQSASDMAHANGRLTLRELVRRPCCSPIGRID